MSALGFELVRPWWLLALPVLLLAGLVLWRNSRSLGDWSRAIDPALLAALRRRGDVREGRSLGVWWPVAAAMGVALALTGPAKLRGDGAAFRNLDGIVIAVDLSPEMVGSGDLPQALLAARLVAQTAGSRQTALIVYAGDAYLAMALTTDSRAFGDTLALVDDGTMNEEGARPDRALALAREVLREAEIRIGDVVLVTSGAGLDTAAEEEARQIAAMGSHLSVLMPGVDAGGARLATIGEGEFASFTAPEKLIDTLNGRVASRLAEAGYSVILWRDYGRYLLLLAMFPALALFRRSA